MKLFAGASVSIVTVILAACVHGTPTEPDPSLSWLSGLIAQMEAEPVTNPPSRLTRYRYNGATVYFRPQWCCDQMSVLYRTDGTVICHPDGGFAGTGDRRCADFFDTRKDEELVWRDPRAKS